MPLHAQDEVHDSSSWIDQVPDFRQEICQSNYRNNPVKYDLNHRWRSTSQIILQILCCVLVLKQRNPLMFFVSAFILDIIIYEPKTNSSKCILSSSARNSAPTSTKPNGARADTKFGFRPPHPPKTFLHS